MYLNSCDRGGETAFFDCLGSDAVNAMREGDRSKIAHQVTPKLGKAVVFWATLQSRERPTALSDEFQTDDGVLLHEGSVHAGLPAGDEKQIAACWVWPFDIDIMKDVHAGQPFHMNLPPTDHVVI